MNMFCRILGHKFTMWKRRPFHGEPLPWAYCERCGVEL